MSDRTRGNTDQVKDTRVKIINHKGGKQKWIR